MRSYGFIRAKASLAILISLLLVHASCEDTNPVRLTENLYTQMGLKGTVKMLKTTDYRTRLQSDSVVRGDMLSGSVYLFNPDGNLKEDRQYNGEGKLIWKSLYKYDNSGNLSEKATYLDSTDLKNRVVYKYDVKKNIVEETSFNNSGSLEYKISYKYNAKGQLIEKLIFRPSEKNWNISLSYDENKNIKRSSSYTVSEAQTTRYIYRHDKEGKKVEEIYYRPDGSKGSRYVNIYNDKGKRIEYSVYGSDDSLLYKSVFKYDDSGNMIERQGLEGDADLSIKETNKFDSAGNLVESVSYNKWMVSRTSNAYLKYDKSGNWLIRRVIVSSFVTGKQYSYIETDREITYF
jgi:hypothetical protein